MNYRGPFISLRIYDEFVVVGYAKTIVLKFEEIESVEIKKWMGTVSDRIQIKHHQPDAPSKIIIRTTNPDRIKEIIESRLLHSSWMVKNLGQSRRVRYSKVEVSLIFGNILGDFYHLLAPSRLFNTTEE